MSSTQTRPVAPKPVATGQRILIPATNTVSRTGQPLASIPASALSQIQGNKLKFGKFTHFLTISQTGRLQVRILL